MAMLNNQRVISWDADEVLNNKDTTLGINGIYCLIIFNSI